MNRKIDELLTKKQQKFMLADDKRINILSGSVRSGKTYVSLLKWATFVAQSDKKDEFLMCGVTLTTLKRNCLDLLTDLVGSNNFRYSITAKEGRLFGRRVFLEGDSDSSREGNIRGTTLKGAYVDEVTLCNEDFFKMLLSRLSVANAKLYATCNPDTPIHYIKTDYIDREKDLNLRVWEFLLEDNTFLPEDYLRDLKTEYTGVFYERYILGAWVKAEGLIFPMYDEVLVDEIPNRFEQYCLSMDYGTQNAFAAMLWGLNNDVWYGIDEYYYSGRETGVQKTDDEYWQDIEEFLDKRLGSDRPNRIETIIDPSAASFIVLLKKKNGYKVRKADNEVVNGLRETATAMKRGKIKVYKKTMKNWRKEAQGYVWDEKKGEDAPIKENDHAMDATRYFVKTKKICKIRREVNDNLSGF